jgi:hypothetical protein
MGSPKEFHLSRYRTDINLLWDGSHKYGIPLEECIFVANYIHFI